MFYLTTHTTHLFKVIWKEGRKEEIFYLTTHTAYIFTVIWKELRKEGNVLFNDALNTFIFRYMASDI